MFNMMVMLRFVVNDTITVKEKKVLICDARVTSHCDCDFFDDDDARAFLKILRLILPPRKSIYKVSSKKKKKEGMELTK
jgi:hypothetical protein